MKNWWTDQNTILTDSLERFQGNMEWWLNSQRNAQRMTEFSKKLLKDCIKIPLQRFITTTKTI